jgi:hypothetical protein
MLEELNPFGWPVIISFVGSVGLFYLIGAMLISKVEEPFLSIGLRIALGALCSISVFAIVAAGKNTGMIFYAMLFIWMFWQNKTRFEYTDITYARKRELAFFILLGLVIFLLEAIRSDLRITEGLYVGNQDASFYASYAHAMFGSGIEGTSENVSPEYNGTIYHFGDLWFSSLYSNISSILPYYSYMILYRSLAVFAFSLMIIGWVRRYTGKYFLGIFSVFMALGAIYLELIPVPLPDLDLFNLFMCYYPIYGAGPYLIVGLAGLIFCVLIVEKNWMLGTVGLLFIALLNGGLIIASAITGGLILISLVGYKIYKRESISSALSKGIPLFIAGIIPFVYYGLDNRFESSGANLFSLEYVYVVVHTFIRACISQVFILPYLLGLLFFWRNSQNGRKLVLVQGSYLLATMLSLAIIFPLVQGNSAQIPSIHFTGILAPICIVGLMSMLVSLNNGKTKIFVAIIIVAIAYQATRIVVLSDYYLVTYDWKLHVSGYKEKATIPATEWTKMRGLLNNKETTRFGYFVCDTLFKGSVHYNEFTFLKSVLPGAVFHRMNALPRDTMLSREMKNAYYRTSLGYFVKQHGFDFEKVEEEHMNYLHPDYLFLPKGKDKYCVSSKWTHNAEPILETTNYLFYGQ